MDENALHLMAKIDECIYHSKHKMLMYQKLQINVKGPNPPFKNVYAPQKKGLLLTGETVSPSSVHVTDGPNIIHRALLVGSNNYRQSAVENFWYR